MVVEISNVLVRCPIVSNMLSCLIQIIDSDMRGSNRRNVSTSQNHKRLLQEGQSPQKHTRVASSFLGKRSGNLNPTNNYHHLTTKIYQEEAGDERQSRKLKEIHQLKEGILKELRQRNQTEPQEPQGKENKDRRSKYRDLIYPVKSKMLTSFHNFTKDKFFSTISGYSKFSHRGHQNQPNQDKIMCGSGIFIVCDGHGSEGREVSSFVARSLMDKLTIQKDKTLKTQDAIIGAFDLTNDDLDDETRINTYTSGSTALLVWTMKNNLYCANAGDCRAILSKRGEVVEISNQHRPDKPKERERIFRLGGEIKKTPGGPYRLYNPEKKYGVGGLSVSRGFGDTSLRGWGLIHRPQITEFELTCAVDFIILGSDGFYEFFTPAEVVKFTYTILAHRSNNVAEDLVTEARRRWQGFSETDDISCVFVKLN